MTALAVPNEIAAAPSATAPNSSMSPAAHYLPLWMAGAAAWGSQSALTWEVPPADEGIVWLASTAPWPATTPTFEHTLLTQAPENAAATFRRAVRVLKYWAAGSAATGGAFQLVRGTQPALSGEESFNRLREFETLTDNWDSYSSDPISSEAIAVSRELLLALMQPTPWGTMAGFLPSNIVPLADGGVQFEWFGVVARLEVEVGADKKLSCFFAVGRGDARRSTVLNDAAVREVISLVSLASGAPVRWRTNL